MIQIEGEDCGRMCLHPLPEVPHRPARPQPLDDQHRVRLDMPDALFEHAIQFRRPLRRIEKEEIDRLKLRQRLRQQALVVAALDPDVPLAHPFEAPARPLRPRGVFFQGYTLYMSGISCQVERR